MAVEFNSGPTRCFDDELMMEAAVFKFRNPLLLSEFKCIREIANPVAVHCQQHNVFAEHELGGEFDANDAHAQLLTKNGFWLQISGDLSYPWGGNGVLLVEPEHHWPSILREDHVEQGEQTAAVIEASFTASTATTLGWNERMGEP